MRVFKCKMCGGNISVTSVQSYCSCDFCGTNMTIPKAVDDRILNLFNRANDYRMQNEFDKALATYEGILDEDNTNAEAHWGCVLSKYGIEYVEDPKTRKRIPTCHRVQSSSILSDLDYKKALEFSDDGAKTLYEKEAAEIWEIQKRILEVANKEEAYDIFICYKETDENGKRTMDSVLAQDIYFQLQNEGYKVFFSRITLEDKLGQEYEPYIFAALNSAKIMLVVGTKPEYFNAVWVKNEWSRFLNIVKNDRGKLIIPCYRDMDAYSLPDELSLFQSQDMGRIGFIQDLLRGIGKVITKGNPSEKKEHVPDRELLCERESTHKRETIPELMTIEDVFTIAGRGTVVTGFVKSGTISVGETVIVNNRTFTVAGLEQFHKLINIASEGMAIGMLIKDATKHDVMVGDSVYKKIANHGAAFHVPTTPDEIAKELLNAGYQNRRLDAIKIMRERTGLGLKEAKDVIDRNFPGANNTNYSVPSVPSSPSTPTPAKSGCYVATAVYGSYDCPEVWALRRYRDYFLAKTWYGRAFIKVYYAISPTLVKWFGHTMWFKNMWKSKLDRIVENLRSDGIEDTPYQDKNW